MKAISLPSGDQTGPCSLCGVRDTLYGGREPSTDTIHTSRLKSASSYDATSHLPSGDQSYSISLNEAITFLASLPSGAITHSSPRSLTNATFEPSGLQVRCDLAAPSRVSGVSLNFVFWNQYFAWSARSARQTSVWPPAS